MLGNGGANNRCLAKPTRIRRALCFELVQSGQRLPPFWPERPAVWFAQTEAQFTLAGISNEQTKFCYVISQLDQRYTSEVEDIITCPTE
jgi:hypothetical protein